MKIPLFNPLRNENEVKEIKNTVLDVIDSGVFIGGEQVEKFEKEFANYIGVKYCIGVNSGTDALVLAFKLCGIENKEAIIPANTFIATPNAAVYVGGIPRLVDVNPEIYNIDPILIKKNITNKTKVIVPVHLFGHPCEMDEIMNITEEKKLFVIEDCAQAHGSMYKNRKVGGFGLMGCFSFYPSKNLGCFGDGGAVVTNDEDIANKLKMFREYGQNKKYYHDSFGINTRLDSIQASVLRIKIKNLDKNNKERRNLAKIYKELFEDVNLLDKIILPVEKEWAYHVYYVFVIRVLSKLRDRLISYLQENGVGAQIHYPIPIHKQKCYEQFKSKVFPVTEKCADEIISLPLFPGLKVEEMQYIIDKIKDFFNSSV